MPLVFIVLGVLFLVVAVRGTHGDLWALLKSEFQGDNSFVVWASAIVILALIGFWKTARPVTDAGIGLIFLVLIVSNKGFFDKLNSALRNPVAPSTQSSASPSSTTTTPSVTPSIEGAPVLPGNIPQGIIN